MPMPAFRKAADVQQAADAAPAAPQRTQQNPAARQADYKPNQYGGKCHACGVYVPAQQGMLVGSRQTGWGVQHVECPADGQAAPQEQAATHQQNVINGEPLFDGIYTYETLTAHRTFRLRTQGLDEDFMPGVQIIQHLTGPDNTHDYESFGHIKGGRLYVWKRFSGRETLVNAAKEFLADPHGDNVVAAINCYRCGKTLTVPASVHNGLGPDCARRGMGG